MSQATWPTENCNHWLQKLAWSHVSIIQLALLGCDFIDSAIFRDDALSD